ncbi:MAG: preprotein translocase subunit SecG [Candidatus Zixiibacteriota bacterium]
MFVAWVIFHVLVCLALILVVLMQSSKGEGLAGSAFGGGLSSAVFGGRGAATFLSKATTVLAILFMFNCGALAFMSGQTRSSTTGAPAATGESAVTRQAQEEMQRQMQQQQQAQPTTPGQEGTQQVTPGEASPFNTGDTGK